MHFSVLFILEGFKKEDLSNEQIKEMFYEEFCNQETIDRVKNLLRKAHILDQVTIITE